MTTRKKKVIRKSATLTHPASTMISPKDPVVLDSKEDTVILEPNKTGHKVPTISASNMVETTDWLKEVQPERRFMFILYLHGDQVELVKPEPAKEVLMQVRHYRDKVSANPMELFKLLGVELSARQF